MVNKSFFFIPDISGFTSFVKGLDIDHSQHIISELLELIIDEDELGLSVAEVEGDAVFFYKNDGVPSFEQIINQVNKTYKRFHEHLKIYENRRICHCGACSTTSKLTLKFVVHAGQSSLMNVKGHSKPYGSEVIKVHRLLKNSIEGNDYALFSEDLLKEFNTNDALEFINGSDYYEELGTVEYKSFDLSDLKLDLKEPNPISGGTKVMKPLILHQTIESSKDNVFELISNLELRTKWTTGLDSIQFDRKALNQIGTKHVCVVGNRNLEFETVVESFGKGNYVYGEKTNDIPIFKESTTYFILEGDENSTNLRVEIHFELVPIIGWLLKPLFMKKLIKSIKDNLISLKNYAETA